MAPILTLHLRLLHLVLKPMLSLIQYVRRFVVTLLGALLLSVPVAAQEAEEQDQQAVEFEMPAGLQTEFTYEPPEDLQTKLPQDKARELKERKQREPWGIFKFLGTLGPLFKLIFYGLLAAAVGFIIFTIVREIVRIRNNMVPKDKDEDMPEAPDYQPDAETARILLADAEKLAAQGKYEEAVHAILFRTIQDIQDKRPHHVKRSLTSREISRLPILSEKARKGFSMIGRLVENSFFGGGTLTEEDYTTSVATYKNFAFGKTSAGAKRR